MYLRLLFCVVLLCASDLMADESPAVQLVTRLENLNAFSARYEQTGDTDAQTGNIRLQKPDRFHVTADPPLSQTIVSDGVSLWVHDMDLEQVVISRLEDVRHNIPLLLIAGDPDQLAEQYSVERIHSEDLVYFVLTPVDPSPAIAGVALAFSAGVPVSLSFETAMGQRTLIRFFESSLGPIAPVNFHYTIPAGVDVIDDRVRD